MPKILSMPTHLRPREKLLERDIASLTTAELFALLIRTGRAGHSAISLGENIVKKYSDFTQLTLDDLKAIKGLDIAKVSSILAALELSHRLSSSTTPHIQSPIDALPYLARTRTSSREQFVALYLNARHELIHQETISVGTLTRSLVHPREVFAPALTHATASLLIAHNHPSGDTEPSEDDLALTRRLVEASDILGIPILDHLILTGDSFYSFREHGHLT